VHTASIGACRQRVAGGRQRRDYGYRQLAFARAGTPVFVEGERPKGGFIPHPLGETNVIRWFWRYYRLLAASLLPQSEMVRVVKIIRRAKTPATRISQCYRELAKDARQAGTNESRAKESDYITTYEQHKAIPYRACINARRWRIGRLVCADDSETTLDRRVKQRSLTLDNRRLGGRVAGGRRA
jgi:hypothetical protein